ncbi:hypothetical protein BH23PAT2_BH23PAT2_00360 [soil metagenome]
MENSLIFLIVVLSVFLAFFLLLGIILLVKSIQIANRVKHITDQADGIVQRAETAIEFFRKAAGPLAIGKLVTGFVDHMSKSKKDKGDS